MKRILAGLAFVLSTAALAQQPTLTPHPFMVLTREVTSAQVETLQREYRRLLVSSELALPTRSVLTTAVTELKRQDCESSDECLVRLAVLGNTMYALVLVAVREPDGTATLTGRVVRSDGKVMVGPLTKKERRRGNEAVDATMMRGLGAWMQDAKLSALPAVKEVIKPQVVAEPTPPVDAGVPVAVVAPVDAGVISPPPAPPLEQSPLATVGTVTTVVGAGTAVVGGTLLIIGAAVGSSLDVRNGAVRADQAAQAAQSNMLQGVGGAIVGVGAAAAAAGLVMMLVAPAQTPAVSMVPVPGGAVVAIGGVL